MWAIVRTHAFRYADFVSTLACVSVHRSQFTVYSLHVHDFTSQQDLLSPAPSVLGEQSHFSAKARPHNTWSHGVCKYVCMYVCFCVCVCEWVCVWECVCACVKYKTIQLEVATQPSVKRGGRLGTHTSPIPLHPFKDWNISSSLFGWNQNKWKQQQGNMNQLKSCINTDNREAAGRRRWLEGQLDGAELSWEVMVLGSKEEQQEQMTSSPWEKSKGVGRP